MSFVSHIPHYCIQYVEMYHSKTDTSTKKKILDDMSIENGQVRLLICTSAAGMGVNFSGIKYVINFGPPKNIDDLLQQFGRAGRDGTRAFHILLHMPRHCRYIQKEMLEYIQTKNCLRQQLMAFYGVLQESEKTVVHYCCYMCAAKCICGGTDSNANKEHPLLSLCEEHTDDVDDNCIDSMRVCEDDELCKMLSTSIDFHHCLHDFEESYKTCDIVNSVIENLPYLLFHDNVVELCKICCTHVVLLIMADIQSYFGRNFSN